MSTIIPSFLQAVVNIFFSARFRVYGSTMLPSLRDGDSVFVVRTRFKWNNLQRGDVVAFQRSGGIYIKRVIGLPGEDINVIEGQVYIDELPLTEAYTQGISGPAENEWFNGPDEYFLLGDNRGDSNDSRKFGSVSADQIIGRAWFLCWPPWKWRPLAIR